MVSRLRVQKIILISLVLTSAVSWILLSRQSDADNDTNNVMMKAMMSYDPLSISLFTISWTVGMAAMMFPAITPMVLLYNRLIGRGRENSLTRRQKQTDETLAVEEERRKDNNNRKKSVSLRLILFVTSYLVIWALTGIALLVGWSIPMNSFLLGNGKQQQQLIGITFGVVLILSGLYQFSPLKTKCLVYCESPLSFFMRRWKNGTVGAIKMGMYHGLYCLGCCWPYFLIMVVLGWMNLLWMALFAGVIFGEKIWSKGNRIARGAGFGFAIVGIMTIFGLIIITPTGISSSNNNNSTSRTDGRIHMGGSVNMDMKMSKNLNTSRQ